MFNVVVYTAPKETKISTPETKTKRQWELWSSDDKDAFFEALFEVCIPKSSHHTNDMLYWRTFLNNMALCLALTRKHHEFYINILPRRCKNIDCTLSHVIKYFSQILTWKNYFWKSQWKLLICNYLLFILKTNKKRFIAHNMVKTSQGNLQIFVIEYCFYPIFVFFYHG